jgi:alpha-galactosidase
MEYLTISYDNVKELQEVTRQLAANEDLDLPEEGAAEYAPQIIHSILTGVERKIHVNVPNKGLIDNLPQDAVVEVPALVDSNGVHPLPVGKIPTMGAALNRTLLSVAELTVEAALTGDPLKVRQAMLVDGNAASSLTPDQIWELADDLTRAHGSLMPSNLGGEADLLLP